MKIAVGWTIQRVMALGVVENLPRVDTLTYSIGKILALRACLDTFVVILVHKVPSFTFASGF
jgi:hypothetical protein